MVSDDPLLMKFPAEADNLRHIREAVALRGRELGLEDQAIDALRTVVSEACANVILHAYPGEAADRPMEVEIDKRESTVMVAVRDKGIGIHPDPQPEHKSLRLGLQLIGAMASSFQIRCARNRGTELLVHLPLIGKA